MMQIRFYSKQELAMLYFPEADPRCARKHLRRWIYKCPELVARLADLHLSIYSKVFTPRQVALIIEYLGEP